MQAHALELHRLHLQRNLPLSKSQGVFSYFVRLEAWTDAIVEVAHGLAKTMSQASSTANPVWCIMDYGFLERLTM